MTEGLSSKFPPVDLQLLEALDKEFPERCPEPTWDDRQIWLKVGQRQVVRLLWQMYRNQQEEDKQQAFQVPSENQDANVFDA